LLFIGLAFLACLALPLPFAGLDPSEFRLEVPDELVVTGVLPTEELPIAGILGIPNTEGNFILCYFNYSDLYMNCIR